MPILDNVVHGEFEMTIFHRSIVIVAWLLSALVSLPSIGDADVVLDLTIAEMAETSTAVVHGSVTRIDTAWNDSHTRIFTDVTVSVSTYLVGQGADTIHVRQVGGRIGDTELLVTGQPRFDVGEEVVLFLEPDGSGQEDSFVVVCMSAGKFNVSFDHLTGERVVGQDLRGLNVVPARGRRTVRTHTVARPFLFRELIETVTRAVAEGGAQ